MSFTSYAQNYEDVLLRRAFHDVENGRYLDIGAQDPVVDSVSLAFYEAGWRGIHVEPTPDYAGKLRSARPDEVVVQAAVSDDHGPIEFFEFPGTGLSTGKATIADRHAKAGFNRRKIIVPTISLQHLLDGAEDEFHWVKIDVEGMEAEVLRSWSDSARRPWLFLVEATSPLSQDATHAAWLQELLKRDYREMHFDGLSRYFLHETQADRGKAFDAPPNVFDLFVVSRRHFSAGALSGQLETLEQQIQLQQSLEETLREQLLFSDARLAEEQSETARLRSLVEDAQAERETARNEAKSAQVERETARTEAKDVHDAWVKAEQDHRTQIDKLIASQSAMEVRYQKQVGDALATVMAHSDRVEGLNVNLIQTRREADQLRFEASELRARIEAADQLVATALAVPLSRWERFGRAVGLVRIDPARSALLRWKLAPRGTDEGRTELDMSSMTLPEVRPYLHANSLGELLSLDEEVFVRSAYATMLGREADPEGEAYYRERLRKGVPKLQILYQMRRSKEAKLLHDPLPGLESTFRRYRFQSLFRGRKAVADAIAATASAEAGQAHVHDFMQYYDEEFVRVAFRYYLGREPDGPGLDHYLVGIRRGLSRQRVLADIARSREARLRGRRATGQRSLEVAVDLDRIPLLGALVVLLKFSAGIKHHMRDMRAMQNHLYRLSKKIG